MTEKGNSKIQKIKTKVTFISYNDLQETFKMRVFGYEDVMSKIVERINDYFPLHDSVKFKLLYNDDENCWVTLQDSSAWDIAIEEFTKILKSDPSASLRMKVQMYLSEEGKKKLEEKNVTFVGKGTRIDGGDTKKSKSNFQEKPQFSNPLNPLDEQFESPKKKFNKKIKKILFSPWKKIFGIKSMDDDLEHRKPGLQAPSSYEHEKIMKSSTLSTTVSVQDESDIVSGLEEKLVREWTPNDLINWLKYKQSQGYKTFDAINDLKKKKREMEKNKEDVDIKVLIDSMDLKLIIFPKNDPFEREIFNDELNFIMMKKRYNRNVYHVIRKLKSHKDFNNLFKSDQYFMNIVKIGSDKRYLRNLFITEVKRTIMDKMKLDSYRKACETAGGKFIKVHIVITKTSGDGNVLQKTASGFLKVLLGNTQQFGLYHTAISLGIFYLQWTDLGVVFPKTHKTRKGLLYLHIGEICLGNEDDEIDINISKVAENIVNCIMKWNTKIKYNRLKFVVERNKEGKIISRKGNCQNFVYDVLNNLEKKEQIEFIDYRLKDLFLPKCDENGNIIKKKKKSEHAKNFYLFNWLFKELRTKPNFEFRFYACPEFRKAFKLDEKKSIYEFKLHKEFDLWCVELSKNISSVEEFQKIWFQEFYLLKGLDRAFWLRFYEAESKALNFRSKKQEIPEELEKNVNDNCPLMKGKIVKCIFRDPKDMVSMI